MFAQRTRGFTLLEMILVITLLAVLLAGAYGGITSATRAIHSGEITIERVDKIRTVQEFLRRQISRTLPFPYGQTQTTREVFQGDEHLMRFVAPMPGYLSHGGAYVQTLQLVSGDDGMQLVFDSALLNGFDASKSGSDTNSRVVLLDHIRSGTFNYRGLDQQQQLMRWETSWRDPSVTPLMVAVELELGGKGQMNWPTLTIPLMMDVTAQRTGPIGLRQ